MKKLHEQKKINVDSTKIIEAAPEMIKSEHPDPRNHQIVSFIKSVVRIIGYGLLFVSVPVAAVVLIASEIIGIYEELV